MTADIIIPPGLKGDLVEIIVLLEDGSEDDLTIYDEVILNVYSADFTSHPITDLDVTSSPHSVDSSGSMKWDPLGNLTTPGKYFATVTRKVGSSLIRPNFKTSIEVTQQS